MSARISCITLPVKDLKKSLIFYRDGLGFPAEDVVVPTESDDHIALLMPGDLYLVLLLRDGFSEFSHLLNNTTAEPNASECLLSYFASSKEEVDQIFARAKQHGGQINNLPTQQAWGYSAYVKDPDGHFWEIMFNPKMNATLESK